MSSLLQLWTGPLPRHELFPDRKINPLLHWLIHPLKRHLAKYYLLFLHHVFGLKIIAITGSAGKTTTKDMLYSILSTTHPTLATYANITPTYNLPTTILKATPSTRFLILEMGVEYPGDMDFYLWLAQPDIAIITSINLTHTYYLGSIEGVAAEKGKLIASLPKSAVAILNADDPHIPRTTSAKVINFGVSSSAQVHITKNQINPDLTTQITLTTSGKNIPVSLPTLGLHLAPNAAAAAAAALECGISPQLISYGLQKYAPPPHRMQPHTLSNGCLLIDDGYNANPLAFNLALSTLLEVCRLTHKQPALVMSQMNELGKFETSAHEQLGYAIKKSGIKDLFTTGPASQATLQAAGYGQYLATTEDLYPVLKQFVASHPQSVILLKASRLFHFETLVEQLSSL